MSRPQINSPARKLMLANRRKVQREARTGWYRNHTDGPYAPIDEDAPTRNARAAYRKPIITNLRVFIDPKGVA